MWTGCVSPCAVAMRSLATCVEEKQEVNDRRQHREVAQDEMERTVQDGVEGLAGVEGQDVVGLSLRYEQGGASVGAGEGPLLPVADNAVSREHLRDPLDEGAGEQLHVQLAQGYEPVVVQLGRARDLRGEMNVRISPLGRWRDAREDGPIGVDEEPLHCNWEGLDEGGLYVVGARGLAMGLVQCGLQILH